ncbi:MAG: Mut7-C RNAse domain-containing protein [Candidatus Omnitrophota bacterium]
MHKFIVTKELGRLAKWLRIFGFDTEYYTSTNLSSLLIAALRENRIILTRNSKIGRHAGLRILKIESDFLAEQLREIFKELNFPVEENKMFSRCIICNEALRPIEKEAVRLKVPEFVYNTNNKFVTCPNCARIYWQGTHWGNVKETIAKLSNC